MKKPALSLILVLPVLLNANPPGRMDGYDAVLVEIRDGESTGRSLPHSDASASGIRRIASIELFELRPHGRPLMAGGFSDPDTTGMVRSLDHRLREEIIWFGETRSGEPGSFRARMGNALVHYRAGSLDTLRSTHNTGIMCLLPRRSGRYHLPDHTLDLSLLLPEFDGPVDSLKIPFPFFIDDSVFVELPERCMVIDLPDPIESERSGFRFERRTRVEERRIICRTRFEAWRIRFVGEEAIAIKELKDELRAQRGRGPLVAFQ